MSDTLTVAMIGAAATVIGSVLAYRLALRKLPLEHVTAAAEAEVKDVQADTIRLNNYNTVLSMMEETALKLTVLRIEFGDYRLQSAATISRLETELATEREERAKALKRAETAESKLVKRDGEVAQLRDQVTVLQGQVD